MPPLRLIPAAPDHAAIWHAWRAEPAALDGMPLDAANPTSIEGLSERFSKAGHDLRIKGPREYVWFAVDVDDPAQTPLGFVCAISPDHRDLYLEVGYHVPSANHGRGIATRATALLLDHVFTEAQFRRATATVAVTNGPSIRVLEKLGFKQEGTLRQHRMLRGHYVDWHSYGLLRDEWSNRPRA